MRFFHGSDASKLEELFGDEPGYQGSLGWGLYLTTQEEFARVFGKHLYEAFPKVPEKLVLYIDIIASYECGQSMEMYTPGSTPFTFEVKDRSSGDVHRYSVLGDCEEEVKEALMSAALEDVSIEGYDSDDPEVAAAFNVLAPHVLSDAYIRDDIRNRLSGLLFSQDIADELDGDLDDDQFNELVKLLEALATDAVAEAEEQVEAALGVELDLSDISATVSEHGYSAFFIDEYAPGDEFVIVDPEYLPVPVVRVS
jgi:hypothetical protein